MVTVVYNKNPAYKELYFVSIYPYAFCSPPPKKRIRQSSQAHGHTARQKEPSLASFRNDGFLNTLIPCGKCHSPPPTPRYGKNLWLVNRLTSRGFAFSRLTVLLLNCMLMGLWDLMSFSWWSFKGEATREKFSVVPCCQSYWPLTRMFHRPAFFIKICKRVKTPI